LNLGAVTAVLTNPIWVIKVRLFTTHPSDPGAYRGFFHGMNSIAKTEGLRGLWKGTSLALFGVSNGALQFMAYEEMKKWGFARQRRTAIAEGKTWNEAEARLVSSFDLVLGEFMQTVYGVPVKYLLYPHVWCIKTCCISKHIPVSSCSLSDPGIAISRLF